LLFIPSRAPMDLFMRDGEHGINLYIKRVFIMHDCKELIPAWLRFMKGVVDSEDLSLNISREILQQNRQIQQIKKGLTRKVLDTLKTMLRDEREAYDKFWNEFGRALKEGIFQDYANREALLELSLFHSTHGDERTTLADYIERMKPDQDAIYYLAGETRAALLKSPHLEAFRARGYEVLLLDDPVDEVWSQNVPEIKGKAFKSIGRGEVQLGSEEERKQHEEELKEKAGSFKDLLGSLQGRLADHIKEVRLSSRLVESPACLVTAEGEMSPQIEQLLRASGQEVPHTKRILELNPDHAFIKKMQALQSLDPTNERLARYSEFLYGQAVLAEGGSLPDPAAFSKTVLDLVMQGEA
jgi:molecular chaperone HtpG